MFHMRKSKKKQTKNLPLKPKQKGSWTYVEWFSPNGKRRQSKQKRYEVKKKVIQ